MAENKGGVGFQYVLLIFYEKLLAQGTFQVPLQAMLGIGA